MSEHTQLLGDITKFGYNGYDMVKLDYMSGKKLRSKLNSTILKNFIEPICTGNTIFTTYNHYNST